MNLASSPARRRALLCLSAAVLLAGAPPAGGAPRDKTKTRTYAFPDRGTIVLDVPLSWRGSVLNDPWAEEGDGPTIVFSTDADSGFVVTLSPTWNRTGDPDFNSPREVRRIVEEARRGVLRLESMGPPLPLEPLCAGAGTGYHFSARDEDPGANDYKHLMQGAVAFGNVLAAFTVLHDDADGRPAAQALRMLRKVACGESRTGTLHEVRLPGMDWTLVLDLPGYVIEEERVQPDRRGTTLTAVNDDDGLVVSVALERQRRPVDSRSCRAAAFPRAVRSPTVKSRVRRWERGPLALGEYIIRTYRDLEVMQKNVHAYLGKGGFCMNLQVSKLGYRKSDAPLFDAVLSGIDARDDG